MSEGVALHRVPTLVTPDMLRQELDALTDVSGARAHVAKAEALRKLATAIDRSGELAREFAEVGLRAARRGGEMLAAMPELGPGKPDTLTGFGLTYSQSSRWQRIASIPVDEFEAYIAAAHAARRDLTAAGALKLAKRSTVTPVAADHPKSTTAGRFATVVIDPPWRYGNVATRGAAEDHYSTMSLDELAELEMPAADDAHLYLWVTNSFVRDGFDLLAGWGFTYKTMLTWCKPQIGMGNWFRNSTEHVLFGVRGKLATLRNDEPTHFVANRTRHSEKPDSFYDLAERCSPGPRMEMFARRRRLGWDSWGNEA